MKRICALIMLLVAIMSGLSVTVNAESGTCGNGVNWSYDGRTLTISGSGAMKDYGVVADRPWEGYLSSITHIEIEEGVTRIGDRAFFGCISLRSVYMAKSVKTIGDYAFASTSSLEVIGLGKGVTTLETNVFELSSLRSIEIPKSLTKIGKNCFTNEHSEINNGLEYVYYEGSYLDWQNNVTVASGNYALEASGFKMITNQQLALKMSLSNSSISITAGSSQVITARNWENVGLDSTQVKWTSSNTSVATVSYGKITGKSAGTATITASYHGYTVSCTVTVTSVYVEPEEPEEPELVLSYITPPYSGIKIGETLQLRAVSTTGEYMSGVTWSSSHNGIATVSSSGVVTGISTGDVTITAGYNGRYVSAGIYVDYSINFTDVYLSTNEWDYSEYTITYDQIDRDYTASVYILRTDWDGNYAGSYVYDVTLPAYSSEAILHFPEYSMDGYLDISIGVTQSDGIQLGRLDVDDLWIYKVLRDIDDCLVHITGYMTADIYWGGYNGYDEELGDYICVPDYVEEDGHIYNITGLCDEAYSGHCYDSLILSEGITKIGKNVCDAYLEDVYYMGSRTQWNEIVIDAVNMYVTNANIHSSYVGRNIVASYFALDPVYSDGVVGFDLSVYKAYKNCTAIVEIRNQELDVLEKEYRFDISMGRSKHYPTFISFKPDDEYHRLFVRFELNGRECGQTIEANQFYAERPVFYENGFGYKNYDDEYAGIVDYVGEDSDVIVPETLGGLPVEDMMYFYAEGIEILHLPSTFRNLEDYILMDFVDLKAVEISEDNPYFSDIDGVVFSKDKKSLIAFPPAKEGKTYTIPYGTETIEAGAFSASTMEEIIIPDTVKYIRKAGLGKSKITKVFIPASVEVIEPFAFGYSEFLEEIKVSEDNLYYSDIDGVLHSKDGTVLYQYTGGKKLHTYKVEDSVTEIAEGAFEMVKLKSLYIPKTVTEIGWYALNSQFNSIIYEGTEEEFDNTFNRHEIGGEWSEWLYSFDGKDVIIDSVGSRYLGGKLTVKVEYDYLTKPGVCYVALYDEDNRMVAADKAMVGLDEDVTEFTFDADEKYMGYTAKAMFWEDEEYVAPVADSVDGSVKKSILIDTVIETDHPCTMGYNYYQYDGECESIDITFSELTDTGYNGSIFINEGNYWSGYSSSYLAGKTMNIKGNVVKLDCYVDEEVYGYKIERIVVNL